MFILSPVHRLFLEYQTLYGRFSRSILMVAEPGVCTRVRRLRCCANADLSVPAHCSQ